MNKIEAQIINMCLDTDTNMVVVTLRWNGYNSMVFSSEVIQTRKQAEKFAIGQIVDYYVDIQPLGG